MRKKSFLSVCLCICTVSVFRCGPLPEDPNKNPDNAALRIIAVNGTEDAVEPVKALQGGSAAIAYSLTLPEFIDSVTVDLVSADDSIILHRLAAVYPVDSLGEVTIDFSGNGTESVVTTIWIRNGKQKSQRVIFDVAELVMNSPPVFYPGTIEFFSVTGKSEVRDLALFAADPDGEIPVFSLATTVLSAAVTLSGSYLSCSADVPAGSYPVSVIAADGKASDTAAVTWTVFTAPEGGAVVVDDYVRIGSGPEATIDVLANDLVPAGSVLSFCGQGGHGYSFIRSGKVVYLPDESFTGTDSLFYVVNGRDTASIIVSVVSTIGANRPPVWMPDTVEFYSVRGVVTAADVSYFGTDSDSSDQLRFMVVPQAGTGFSVHGAMVNSGALQSSGVYRLAAAVSDGLAADSGTVLWTIYEENDDEVTAADDYAVTGPGSMVAVPVMDNDVASGGEADVLVTFVSQGKHGRATVRGGVRVEYIPDAGFTGNDTLLYTLSSRDTAMVYVMVTESVPENRIHSDFLSIVQGSTSKVNVLANDTAFWGQLAVAALVQGHLGNASILDSSIEYSANADAAGSDTVRYLLTGGDTGMLVITVVPVTITVKDDAASVLQGQERRVRVLANDSISNGALKVTGLNGTAALGTVSFNDSEVIYRAQVGVNGQETFTYIVNNGKASGTVTVKVLQIEITANRDSVAVLEDAAAVTVNVLANDAVSAGEVLQVTDVFGARLGTVHVNATADAVVYTPLKDSAGTDVVVYTVNDAVICTLTVVIMPVDDDPPVFTRVKAADTLDENSSHRLLFAADDPDGTPVALSLEGAPAWVTVPGTGSDSLAVTVAPGYDVVTTEGAYTVTFTVRAASAGDTIRQTVTIRVNNVNTVPFFINPVPSVVLNEGSTSRIGFTVVDNDGDPITVSYETTAGWITAAAGGDSLVIAPPQGLVSGGNSEIKVSVTVSAGDGMHVVTHILPVTVRNVSMKPTVSLTAPLVSDTVRAGVQVTFTAEANDQDGSVQTVIFYIDNQVSGSDLSSPYALTLDSLPSGVHTVYAAAVDNDGDTAWSAHATVRSTPWYTFSETCRSDGLCRYTFGPNGNPLAVDLDTTAHTLVIRRFNFQSAQWATNVTRQFTAAQWARLGSLRSVECAFTKELVPYTMLCWTVPDGSAQRWRVVVDRQGSGGAWAPVADTIETVLTDSTLNPQLSVAADNAVAVSLRIETATRTYSGTLGTLSGTSWATMPFPIEIPTVLAWHETTLYAVFSSLRVTYPVSGYQLSGTDWQPLGGNDGVITDGMLVDEPIFSSAGDPFVAIRGRNAVYSFTGGSWQKMWPVNATADTASVDFAMTLINDQMYSVIMRGNQATKPYALFFKRMNGQALEGVYDRTPAGKLLDVDSYTDGMRYRYTYTQEHVVTWFGEDSGGARQFCIAWSMTPD